ncbi:MAG: NrdH-redoxin [Candidatus Taylorbacteria bacterium RIFCSPHIGHO2_01_FULL_46_22b]|uniref:NrdH-redoxin n=1 Tax=Candidatus Taylorbacteria bacterium RIFCSPHIGHO2_01_FULL_46_22b TaxID=1802301 RepID=A0A1G2M445_9BACT|nr:MAG: NrdH-redoxin [Candidatus Taylorbacteria bacterium RIFCSPHIGHO2_01_FULL_46_22b]
MKEVTIYSTPTCVFCNAAKSFFKQNKISFTEHNVATDLKRRQEMVEKSGQMGVPVITVGDDVIVGFDEPRLKELVGVK